MSWHGCTSNFIWSWPNFEKRICYWLIPKSNSSTFFHPVIERCRLHSISCVNHCFWNQWIKLIASTCDFTASDEHQRFLWIDCVEVEIAVLDRIDALGTNNFCQSNLRIGAFLCEPLSIEEFNSKLSKGNLRVNQSDETSFLLFHHGTSFGWFCSVI